MEDEGILRLKALYIVLLLKIFSTSIDALDYWLSLIYRQVEAQMMFLCRLNYSLVPVLGFIC